MTTKELMLGDWIKTTDNSSWIEVGNKVCKVKFIGDDYIVGTEKTSEKCLYGIGSSFEPISLTPEILEKNGFAFYQKNFMSLEYPDSADVFTLEDLGAYDDYGNKTPLWRICKTACIRYVHELQHVLRLCGIDKEISLA